MLAVLLEAESYLYIWRLLFKLIVNFRLHERKSLVFILRLSASIHFLTHVVSKCYPSIYV
jgi:hypothetical protein